MMIPRPIIIDTDPGQDDAIALLLALASPEVEVLAVTTVAGNVPQPLVTDNALALLTLAGIGSPRASSTGSSPPAVNSGRIQVG